MAINTLAGFILHYYWLRDLVNPIVNYWLAAIPVVVVGAPLGAFVCSLLKRQTITCILVSLITIELITSVLFIPLTTRLILYSLCLFVVFYLLYYWMYQTSKRIVKRPIANR